MLRTVRTKADWWIVVEEQDGKPMRVRHAHPAMRGSVLEARMNVALPVWHARQAIRDSLPGWIRRFLREPERWWWGPYECFSEADAERLAESLYMEPVE